MPETILVIDDNPAIGAALAARLEANGYGVTVAGRGAEGVDAARRCGPAAIVLDVRLPDIDGIEVCRQLKNDPDLSSIPVVFLSANAGLDVHDQALAAGGAAFVRKPYDAAALLALLRQQIEDAAQPDHQETRHGH